MEIIDYCLKNYPTEGGNINGFRNCVYNNCYSQLTQMNDGTPVDSNTVRTSEIGMIAEDAIKWYALKICKNPNHYTKVPVMLNNACNKQQQPGNSWYYNKIN